VSKAPVAQNRYKADLRTFRFLLFEQFQLGDILGKGAFEAWGVDEARMVLDESYKFCCEVTGPLNSVGDREGCRLENGEVKTPTGFKAAADRLKEAGWKALSVSPSTSTARAPRAPCTCWSKRCSRGPTRRSTCTRAWPSASPR
jgi:hypothetical protein